MLDIYEIAMSMMNTSANCSFIEQEEDHQQLIVTEPDLSSLTLFCGISQDTYVGIYVSKFGRDHLELQNPSQKCYFLMIYISILWRTHGFSGYTLLFNKIPALSLLEIRRDWTTAFAQVAALGITFGCLPPRQSVAGETRSLRSLAEKRS